MQRQHCTPFWFWLKYVHTTMQKGKGSPYSSCHWSGADPGLRQSAHRWHSHIPASACHYILPGQRLLSHPESINTIRLVPYHIILLCDRGTCVWTTCPESLPWPGVVPSISYHEFDTITTTTDHNNVCTMLFYWAMFNWLPVLKVVCCLLLFSKLDWSVQFDGTYNQWYWHSCESVQ